MARFVYTRAVFGADGFVPVGTVVDALVQPAHAVPEADYRAAPAVVTVERDPNFLSSSLEAAQTWGLPNGAKPADRRIGHTSATKLDGRSPGEGRRY